MEREVKIIALYLPQFHETPENNTFWGKGFTDWVTIKKAKPLFHGHAQPNVPLNNNYYDLSSKEALKWQIDLAKKYGIYGFGIYHYYFSDNVQALTKPCEILLRSPELDMPFFFIWDNGSWKRTWSKMAGNDWAPVEDAEQSITREKGSDLLLEFVLGNELNWKKHFEYLLPYFKDGRYMKMRNKPMFGIIGYSKQMANMAAYWNRIAPQYGFDGVHIIYKYNPYRTRNTDLSTYYYEPHHVAWESIFALVKRRLFAKFNVKPKLSIFDYDDIWHKLLSEAENDSNPNRCLGAFVGYDDTPRRGKLGKVVWGASPAKFENYFRKLIEIANRQKKEYVFLTAWNEWGEGAYVEPDEINQYAYLEAIKKVMEE